MRGAGPAIPREGLAPTFLLEQSSCRLLQLHTVSGRGPQRATKGNCMNQNLRPRRGPQRPPALRRPQSGTGNARQNYERYLARAREAQVAGDVVEMEN